MKKTQNRTQELSNVGGTSGIGAAMAEALSKEGHQLFIVSRSEAPDLPEGAKYLKADILDPHIDLRSFLPEMYHGMACCQDSYVDRPAIPCFHCRIERSHRRFYAIAGCSFCSRHTVQCHCPFAHWQPACSTTTPNAKALPSATP